MLLDLLMGIPYYIVSSPCNVFSFHLLHNYFVPGETVHIYFQNSFWFWFWIVFLIKFLDDVSSTESKEPSGLSEPVHLKEG